MGGRHLGTEPAEIWWRRRTGHEVAGATPATPALQVAATPRKLLPVYEAVTSAVARAQAHARAHASRFDADGGVLFFTITAVNGHSPLELEQLDTVLAEARRACAQVGGCLLGHTNPVVNPYLESLRDALDPLRIMNPIALTARR